MTFLNYRANRSEGFTKRGENNRRREIEAKLMLYGLACSQEAKLMENPAKFSAIMNPVIA